MVGDHDTLGAEHAPAESRSHPSSATVALDLKMDAERSQRQAEIDRLIAAGWKILERSNYSGIKVHQVLAEAGLSTRSFYRYFPTKSALVLGMIEQENVKAAERGWAVVNRSDDPHEQLLHWISAVLSLPALGDAVARRVQRLGIEAAALRAEFPVELREVHSRLLAPLVHILETGRAQALFPDADPEHDAEAIYSMCAGLLTESCCNSPDKAKEIAVSFATRALARGHARRKQRSR
jgi:AcrR family transcriptional regulator